MFSLCKKIWFAVLASTVMFITMFPVATGNNPWPIENFSCIFGFFFLAPIWVCLRHQKTKTVLITSYIYCFFSTVGTLFWFYIAMKKYGNMPGWESMLILASAGFLVGTIRWFAFAVTARFQHIRYFPLFAALIFTLVEWAMFYIPFDGFPWITPAYSITPMTHLAQAVDLFGLAGINFVLFYTNFLSIEWIVSIRTTSTPQHRPLVAVLILLCAMYAYGAHQINVYRKPGTEAPLRVSLLQGNISQELKWSIQERQNIVDTYHVLTKLAAVGKPDLIVWPEASFPKTVSVEARYLEALPENMPATTFVIGAPTYDRDGDRARYQNSAFTLSADGTIQHRYDKVRLVPFGEYIPSFGIPIEKFVPAVAGSFSSGHIDQEISRVGEHPFGLFICFEVLFQDIAASWVNKGAEFFVTITNDAWFDRSSGPYQHLRFARMLSMEFRKPIVRAANTGVTTWFDAAGFQHEKLSLFERGFITAEIYPNRVKTLYARHPHALPAFMWIAVLYIMIVTRKRIL